MLGGTFTWHCDWYEETWLRSDPGAVRAEPPAQGGAAGQGAVDTGSRRGSVSIARCN